MSHPALLILKLRPVAGTPAFLEIFRLRVEK